MVFKDDFPPSVSYPPVSTSQSEKLLLFDTVQSELEEKIRRLEEDRHSIDITSGTNQLPHNDNMCPQISRIRAHNCFR